MSTASTANSEACTSNPSGPGCTQSAADKTAQQNADAMAKLSDANSAQANYNVNDISGTNGSPNLGGAAANQGGGSGPGIKTIANNTGGGIPGGAGGGAAGKSGGILGGNGGGGLFGGSASGIADIDKGLRSGGYSTTPGAGEEEKPDGSNGFSGYGNGRDPASDGKGGLDLKQYLPGGRLAADTLKAAAMQWQSMGIHPSHIDLWTRISEKIQQKCKLGELYDCR